MLKKWLAAHRPLVISAVSGAAIASLVITLAVVSSGYAAQKVTLDDGSVWVSNGTSQVIGRANPQVLALNTVVTSTGTDIQVVQHGATVLLFDRTDAKVDIVDAATSSVLDSAPLPPQQPELFIAGDNVVVGSATTGQFWIVALADLAHFDAQSQPTLSLGADSVASVSPDGVLWVYSHAAHQVYRVDAANSATVDRTSGVRFGGDVADVSISSVGESWVLLDRASRTLRTAGGTIDLGSRIPADGAPVLQQASAAGDTVLVGYSGGLLSVPIAGGTSTVLASGHSGTAVAPAIVNGCSYAAWSDGTADRRCGSSGSVQLHLPSLPGGASRLAFVVNGDTVVLNDPRGGGTWAVQQNGQYIGNWSELITVRQDQQQVQDDSEDTPPEYDKTQTPPVAVDDSLGARPGRSSVLPVLLNDYDPNGDVLVITDFTPIEESIGHLDLINNAQQLQLTLLPTASGSVGFDYTISDGRGGTASAHVTVGVRQPSEDSPPVQVRLSKALVVEGGRVTTSVLGDWVDPDGDAFYLAGASTAEPDGVSYKPEGSLAFAEGGATGGLRSVTLIVSDGRADGTGTLSVTVKAPGQLPIITDPFPVSTYADQEITISPLEHVRGGTGVLHLSSVPAKSGSTIVASLEAGTFRFSSSQVGTHYLEYVVNDGDQTVTGEIRVDVAAPPDANTKPITIPKTIFVQTLSSQTVDVASTDIDPAGGVLLVTGVYNVAQNSGVRADVIEQRAIRVTLTAPLDDGPVGFNYRITNGLSEAEGVVTVVQIPVPARLQPPVANDDSVTVRVGDAIDIPVLANDVQPDGEELTLNPLLSIGLKGDSGLLFASGDKLRYLAPQKTGDFSAVYEISGPDGQVAQAQVKIAVREPVASTNNPPVPATVVGRVLAGQKVRVSIPLTGIDPDGDSVQLLGQETNPDKGSVTLTGPDFFDYQAGDYSAGTDTFTYTVIDALGARATGTVRIGISPKSEGARNPVAVEDEVTARPGATVSVQVLANDSDPDGGTLKIVKVEPNSKDIKTKVVGDIVQITPPKKTGTYGVIYTIENDFGGQSKNFVTVAVTPNAPRAYPVVDDTVLSLTDILNRDSINVNVLRNTFFADGPASRLKVSLLPGYSKETTVTPGKRIHVTVQNKSQIIPFVVANPDDPKIVSYAFVWVPGLDDALPQLNRKAPVLTVASEAELRIDLNDYVLAIGGKKVQLTGTATVQATHANGDSLVVNDHTLRFTSADRYFGPASISFEVTDGSSATDPVGHVATLVLPITVTPRQNQPPVFIGGMIDFEPGSSRDIDLSKLTNYPHPKDAPELAYTVLSPLPSGFSYTLTGQTLSLKANEGTPKGSSTAILLAVRDALATGQSGRIQLNVVASSRPLPVPVPDSVAVARGQTTSVDVLGNDAATNPFPGKPLKVVAIRGLEGNALPAGVSITPNADNSRLSITVSNSAQPGNTTLQYEVADATGDPDRMVWGTVTISVQDKPDAVTGLTATSFGDRRITLKWAPGSDNNSPITGYEVTMSAGTDDSGVTTACAITVCDITTPGNGPSNAVRLRVVAKNALGASAAVALGSPIWSDIVPPAPSVVNTSPLDGGLRISWPVVAAPAGGSAVTKYVVNAGGVSADITASACGNSTCETDAYGLSNGQQVTVTVSPRNGSFSSLTSWNTATGAGVPAGKPLATGTPGAAVNDNTITVNWAGVFSGNGRDITGYTAVAYTGNAPTCGTMQPSGAQAQSVGLATTAAFGGLSSEQRYSVVVFATNEIGCTATSPVAARIGPGVITGASFGGPSRNGTAWDDVLSSAQIGGANLTGDYQLYYRVNGGNRQGPISVGDFINGATYGTDGNTVALRACRSFDGGAALCQNAWSQPFSMSPVPVDPSIGRPTFTSNGVLDDSGGVFSWLSRPSGANYDAVEYSCGADVEFHAMDQTGGNCDTGTIGVGPAELRIRVTANDQTYQLTYDSNGTAH
ncbi:Ig-like domain-containing protein [Lacisediminihabitans changchengi]|uniref:Tandem-95 repeat protein n=1 Tax=Lacisediminihabitans changchengi TaxID=2787634 RepID=A0A934SLE4_9MICO|nr:Ig-like domain-containing protein [Lacisediminihabitans changchengi]MBK4347514.1 tandem-95 repeat protein [Lacisediminihabitans changchengi]